MISLWNGQVLKIFLRKCDIELEAERVENILDEFNFRLIRDEEMKKVGVSIRRLLTWYKVDAGESRVVGKISENSLKLTSG